LVCKHSTDIELFEVANIICVCYINISQITIEHTFTNLEISAVFIISISKKYRYLENKKTKEQSKLKIQKTRL